MRYVKESRIRATPREVFAFHESPEALASLIPPGEPVEIVQPPTSLRPGTRVVLRMRVGPFRRDWVAVHEEYDPPHLFSDRQESGPFARWYHRHQFLDDGQGGTILRDEIEYEPPGGALGRLLGGSLIRRKLERMFAFRHETTRRIVEGQAAGGDPSQ